MLTRNVCLLYKNITRLVTLKFAAAEKVLTMNKHDINNKILQSVYYNYLLIIVHVVTCRNFVIFKNVLYYLPQMCHCFIIYTVDHDSISSHYSVLSQ